MTTNSGRALIEFTEAPLLTMARPFAAAPDVPAERARALQAAFLATHRDVQYLEEAARGGVYISPVSGEDIVRSIDQMSRASPEIFDKVRKLLAGEKGG